MAGILDLFLRQGLFGGGGLLGGGPQGGMYGSEGNDQIWSEQPSMGYDPRARQKAALKQGLLYAGAGLAGGQGWGDGMAKGLLGMGAGMDQGREAFMQDAAFNMLAQQQQQEQARLAQWDQIPMPQGVDPAMWAAASPEQKFELLTDQGKQAPGKVGEYNAALAGGLIPEGTSYQDFLKMDDADTTLKRNYDLAVQQGFKGTIFDYERQMAEAGASSNVTEVNVNAGERETAGYASRAAAASADYDTVLASGYNPGGGGASVQNALSSLPGVGGFLTSDDYKKASLAEKNFIGAVLRKESGAVISDDEYATYGPMYFARPGDSPEIIAFKQQLRQRTIATLDYAAGAAQVPAPTTVTVPPPPEGFEIVQ